MLFLSFQAAAAHVASLYKVEIPVVNESAQVRKLAFRQGLDEVFVRISGDSIIMDKLKRPEASKYVKQFSYEPMPQSVQAADEVMEESGKALTHLLKIWYNGSLMEKYLLNNGFPVWGEYRPDVIVWLVVRDGRNQYILKDSDRSLLKSAVTEAMARRGVPAQWPLYDYKDAKALNVADIRGGFRGPVIKASQRYVTETALSGSMIWNGQKWQSSWSLFVENETRQWRLDDANYNQLINDAVDHAADMLGMVLAVHNMAGNQQVMSLQVDIQGVNTIEKYRYVENYLGKLSAVEQVVPVKVAGQNVVFRVSLRSDEEDFLHLIKNDAELIEIAPPQVITPRVITADMPGLINENKAGTGTDGTSTVETADVQVQAETANETEQSENAEPPKQEPVYYYRLDQL